jgi:hypothetical protein
MKLQTIRQCTKMKAHKSIPQLKLIKDDAELGEIMKVGYTFACFMRKKTVFSQVIQLPTYKSIFFI